MDVERTVITEGFKCSVEQHNLMYSHLIGDGNSSAYSKVIEADPYPGRVVEKVHCRLHIQRARIRVCRNVIQNFKTGRNEQAKEMKKKKLSAVLVAYVKV